MNLRCALRILLALLACSLAPYSLQAQQGCQPPPALATAGTTEANIFSPQQEMDLGDAIAEHFHRSFRAIEDEEVTGYFQRIGERILKHVPPTNLRFQFFLFDQPVANAFAFPGGRIYASRKLVAFARSEDELAGVLGHEIGHLVAHQPAIDMTRRLREVLGVTSVGDRRDIFGKYNQLVENIARKPKAFQHSEKLEQREQTIADTLALYAVASAGYTPQSYAEIWDRFAETKGKTGGWLSDLFGVTKPESRRLREILKALATLPAACVESRGPSTPEEFQRWQAAVVNYSGLGHKESLHAVLAKKALDPPLRDDINHLRFSPDGKYVLAQDDSSIYVLSREPFAPLFRIDAPEAYPAQFTPDSQEIVFYNAGLRVEIWSIAEEQRAAVHELVFQKHCLQTALSPDGKTLACYGSEFDLALFDVASGAIVFQKKSFHEPATFGEFFTLLLARLLNEGEVHLLNMRFSPDARYFAVAARNENALAIDLTTRAPVSIPGSLKKLLSLSFAFVGPDRLVGVDPLKGENSALVRFPSGEILDRFLLGRQDLAAPARGNYLLLRPISNYPVGVLDLATKKIFVANKKAAFDIFDNVYISERRNAEIALSSAPGGELKTVATLPRGPLGQLRAAALSPDLNWLAISERSRGAVWDLAKGERVFYLRGFRGAYFADDGALYADFPKYEKTDRKIARMILARKEVYDGPTIENSLAYQYGAFVVLTKPSKEGGNLWQNVTLEVRDATSGKVLWSRSFPKEAPTVWVEPREATMVLSWAASYNSAKAEIKNDPALGRRLDNLKEKKGSYFLQVLDVKTGNPLGKLLVETGKGSFSISHAFAAGDSVVISDNENRVLIYSLSTGEQKGRMFGTHPTVTRAAGLLCVENERGQLALYDLTSMEKRDQFVFTSPISLVQFSADGKRLFVLTANQTAYWLDLSSVTPAQKLTMSR